MLVTVPGPPSPAHVLEIRKWLARFAPGWESFQISSRAKYLGLMLGPEAAQAQWRAAVAKYDERTQMIAATGAPPSVAARLYASHAVPTMSYIWQLVPLAAEVRRREIYRIHALLHIPQNSCSLAALFNMYVYGASRVPSPAATAWSASTRAALVSVPGWQDALAELRLCEEADGDIGRLVRGLLSPSSWDSTSVAEHLELATSPVRCRREKHTRPARALSAALAKHGGAAAFGALPTLQAKIYHFYLSEI